MPSYRDLPGIDALLATPELKRLGERYGLETVKRAVRRLQNEWRESGRLPDWVADPAAYATHLVRTLAPPEYRRVFNLSGTILHTNLGRAPLSAELYRALEPLMTQPLTLEYDLANGARGDRDGVVTQRLEALCGADAATVVNNNAAALMLCLNTLALGTRVPVSRGELIEIGGSFRLPELMERSGCSLEEVGTTNRTHLKDYARAIGPDTRMLLKIHPSNYHIEGFTASVGIADLAELAHAHGLPLCVDLGSGTLVDLARWGLPHEPTAQEVLAQGADLVTFSGDKLLGAVQAGMIVGKREHVDAIKRNPMKRALRPDKLTLAYLAATLRLYDDHDKLPEHLPLLRTLTTPTEVLRDRANKLLDVLRPILPGFKLCVADSACQIGSGALPDQRIPSIALTASHAQARQVRELAKRLRKLPVPVVARVHKDTLWLDLRCAEPESELIESLGALSA